jgi:hypothetical protein
MKPTQFEIAIALIDKLNSEDINKFHLQGIDFPKEVLYSKRMSQKLLQFSPDASEALRLAVHAQHICRWKIARDEYPLDKIGYLKWREALKKLHAETTWGILKSIGYDEEFIKRVTFLIQKKLIKKDIESQILEDVVCLVFLEYYFEDFSSKHDDHKIIDILRKTWSKMSKKGQMEALKLQYSAKNKALINEASSK